VRQALNVESGLDDGLCVPIFFVAIAVAEADAGTSSGHAATNLMLEQIGYGSIGGIPAGIVWALALRFSARHGLIEPHGMQILTAASALLAAGIAPRARRQHLHRTFTGGFMFGALPQEAGGHVSRLVDEGGELFDAVTFIVFGAVILGPVLDELTWQIVLYAVLSLTVVRMLPVALALLGTGARRATVAVLGWFGPRGLASIVFAVILIDDAELPHLRTLVLAIAATIALSIYVHGLTATPLTERYVRWWRSHPRDARPPMESVPAGEHRVAGAIAQYPNTSSP
jgi:NhaP-type Na+/H+ or K+/H+ antiporter